ncbi:HD domain-containing protein [Alisedimentitalea sp. MJ-SS2]|uniref:HD domain-containing protein n=1 Tax=Aliisedimentitalea sp. MJ-SS2 TaxID=3049795 RepID=UPI00291454B1|nr:HD domain-containing protein [Alisedimentitalea sp. MJ-SS2]MDU8927709.1 HD domain-containing protein [Alisedimentitalea sp. MJ-SS2]
MEALRQRLRQVALAEMNSDPAHDLAHLDRVWENARTIASDMANLDMTALLAAAYLHDLINLPKASPNRAQASTLSAKRAAKLLPTLSLTKGQVAATCHAIEAHSFSAGIMPETNEARILRDADRLDALGAIGIARWFATSNEMGRPFYDPDDPFAKNRTPDDRRFALDHWRMKLQALSGGMCTKKGRIMAQERVDHMVDFLAQLATELGTELPGDWRA